MRAVGWRSDCRELRVADGDAASGGARWQAAAGSSVHAKIHSRAPNSIGYRPKARGGQRKLTKGLVEEGEAPVEEIGDEGGTSVQLPWGRRCRGEEEVRGVVQFGEVLGGAFYRSRRGRGGGARGGGELRRWPTLKLGGARGGAVSGGEMTGRCGCTTTQSRRLGGGGERDAGRGAAPGMGGAARPWRQGAGDWGGRMWKMALTGGPHLLAGA
jgi:hypothetical protein